MKKPRSEDDWRVWLRAQGWCLYNAGPALWAVKDSKGCFITGYYRTACKAAQHAFNGVAYTLPS